MLTRQTVGSRSVAQLQSSHTVMSRPAR